MSKLLTSLFVIIHKDMVIAHAFSIEELFNQFNLYLGSNINREELKDLLAFADHEARASTNFTFTFKNIRYKFQQLDKDKH